MDLEAILTTVLATAVLASVPGMLAATGEAIGERAGVLNLGIEGTMLLAGFVAFRVALGTGSDAVALLAGAGAGLVVGCVFGLLVARLRADQVLVGLGLTLAGSGLAAFLFRETFAGEQPLLETGGGRPFRAIGEAIPVIGPAVLGQPWSVYVGVLLALGCGPLLFRTRFGLALRAAGAAPAALEATGASVALVRLAATTLAGALAGFGSGVLVVVELGFFQPGVTAGIGFVAVALAMLGQLTPSRVVVAALAFGLLEGLGPGLQVAGAPVGSDFPQLLPYLGVVVALLLARRRVALPAALGRPFDPAATRGDV